MNEAAWRTERNSRTIRYAGRVLDPTRRILIRADPAYAERYDGQVAILTTANLFARMTPAVVLDIPSVPMLAPLPWEGMDLREFVFNMLYKADPYGKFELRPAQTSDYLIHLGRTGAPAVVHGSGWNVYLGRDQSPLAEDNSNNPIGPALAAIFSATAAFYNLEAPPSDVLLNALTWQPKPVQSDAFTVPPSPDLGTLWTVGTGSVGTAILYFITLVSQRFSTTLFDMDKVKIHNLDRSPIFTIDHIDQPKVDATASFLRDAGVADVQTEAKSLDESVLWRNRESGVPDVLIAAANERNVRSVIESGFPPIQIYGTTGKHWQAAMIRHAPLIDPCSACLFQETQHIPTACATGVVSRGGEDDEQIDAALPFLSFAAGVMAAAEILKLTLMDYPFTPNRVVLNTQPSVRPIHAPLSRRPGCVCQHRSKYVHRKMVADSRFAKLYE